MPLPDTNYLAAGDELLVLSKQSINDTIYSSFPDNYKLWVVDTNLVHAGTPALFLVDRYGTAFTGNDVTFKVTRSGHRNLGSMIGSVTSLGNPVVPNGSGVYHLVFDSTTRVLGAGANELQQLWKASDKKISNIQ